MNFVLIIFLYFSSPTQRYAAKINAASMLSNEDFNKVDTSRIAVLPLDKRDSRQFTKGDRQADLSLDEINKIEMLVDSAAKENNKKYGKAFHIENPSKYYKQLIAVINDRGEKEVWVNCFCHLPQGFDWKKNVILVLDGGSCFFNVSVNLTKGLAFDFSVNNYE